MKSLLNIHDNEIINRMVFFSFFTCDNYMKVQTWYCDKAYLQKSSAASLETKSNWLGIVRFFTVTERKIIQTLVANAQIGFTSFLIYKNVYLNIYEINSFFLDLFKMAFVNVSVLDVGIIKFINNYNILFDRENGFLSPY